MHEHHVDFTLGFRRLSAVLREAPRDWLVLWGDQPAVAGDWLARWQQRLDDYRQEKSRIEANQGLNASDKQAAEQQQRKSDSDRQAASPTTGRELLA